MKLKKIMMGVGAALMALLLAAVLVIGWYFPRYLTKKAPVVLTPADDRITVMSCNVRCLTPLDLGKRS